MSFSATNKSTDCTSYNSTKQTASCKADNATISLTIEAAVKSALLATHITTFDSTFEATFQSTVAFPNFTTYCYAINAAFITTFPKTA